MDERTTNILAAECGYANPAVVFADEDSPASPTVAVPLPLGSARVFCLFVGSIRVIDNTQQLFIDQVKGTRSEPDGTDLGSYILNASRAANGQNLPFAEGVLDSGQDRDSQVYTGLGLAGRPYTVTQYKCYSELVIVMP